MDSEVYEICKHIRCIVWLVFFMFDFAIPSQLVNCSSCALIQIYAITSEINLKYFEKKINVLPITGTFFLQFYDALHKFRSIYWSCV